MIQSFFNFCARFLALSRKELMSIWSDPPSRAILFVPIIVDSLLFGYGATFDLSNVPYAVRDLDRSPTSISLLAHLDGTGFFRRVATLQTTADIERVINTQQAMMVVQIGPQFEQQLMAGETAPIQLILDARNSTTANAAAGYVGAVIDAFNTEQLEKRGGGQPALTVETQAWFNPNLETRWNFVPALIAMLTALQTIILTALSVAREREQGTFDQLLVTPLSPPEIMLGKAALPMLIGLIQSTIVLMIARFWFQIPMAGSLVTLYVGLAAFVLAIVGIGLSVSALSANMQQATLYSFMLLMPLLLLSGFTTPVAAMSRPLQIATLLNPLRHGIDFVRRVYLEGVGLGSLTSDLIPLLLIAAVTLAAAAWLFRHRLV